MTEKLAKYGIPAVESRILFLRGHKVMLDRDLADLYGVDVKRLNEQVRRNIERFPSDFMFQLSSDEAISLRSQIATLNAGRGRHGKYLPYAFTEQGVAMLSGVLRSDRAIRVNIEIMRTFAKLREMIVSHKDLARRLEDIERKYDAQFKIVFDAIRELIRAPGPDPPREKIGFRIKDVGARYKRKFVLSCLSF